MTILEKIQNIAVLSEISKYDNPLSEPLDKPVYGFYHIYCANDWERIVKEQVNSIKESGLYDLATRFFVCAIKTKDTDIYILQQILPSKFEITIETHNPKDYEFPILQYLYSRAQSEDFYCFYFHTKGTSVVEESKKKGEESWRLLMEHFIFEKYNVAINVLNDGFYCYGSLCRNHNGIFHFGGNFWWTDSDYILSLPDIVTLKNNRFNAEFWIGYSSNGWNPFTAFNSTVDTYYIPIPDFLYKKRRLYISDLWPVAKCYYIHILKGLSAKIKLNKNTKS